jgi:hypothetical protein
VIDVAALWLVSGLAFREPSGYGVDSDAIGQVRAVNANRVRWWAAGAFGRSPLARAADRVEAWVLVLGALLLVAAAYPAVAVGHIGYDARSRTIAAEAAARHPVDAVALGSGRADPTMSESTTTTFLVNVRWHAKSATHEATVRADRPAKSGDHLRIWLDNKGAVTSPPLTASDLRTEMFGTVALAWLLMAVMIGGAFAVARKALDRSRNRGWDRGLMELVDNGGGSTTRKS